MTMTYVLEFSYKSNWEYESDKMPAAADCEAA